jgi:hypothetical protein
MITRTRGSDALWIFGPWMLTTDHGSDGSSLPASMPSITLTHAIWDKKAEGWDHSRCSDRLTPFSADFGPTLLRVITEEYERRVAASAEAGGATPRSKV